jgi:hypothetical protein
MKCPIGHHGRNSGLRTALATLLLSLGVTGRAGEPAPLRAGMIGLDTSQVPAFARIFNSPKATGDLAGIKVVAGYPGGTDIPASRDRVKGFTEQLRAMGIEIVAFMEAADESKRQGGAPVSLASVLAKAKVDAATKLRE